VDPLAEKFVGMSSYCSMANNPVRNTDPDGRGYLVFWGICWDTYYYMQSRRLHEDGKGGFNRNSSGYFGQEYTGSGTGWSSIGDGSHTAKPIYALIKHKRERNNSFGMPKYTVRNGLVYNDPAVYYTFELVGWDIKYEEANWNFGESHTNREVGLSSVATNGGGGYTIDMQRIAESPDGTVSSFTAYGPTPLQPVSGYLLNIITSFTSKYQRIVYI
jgi:hypothetical protein